MSAILLVTVTVIIGNCLQVLTIITYCVTEMAVVLRRIHDVLIFLLCSDNAVTFAIALYGRCYVQTSER